MKEFFRRAWAEIYTDRLENNLSVLRKIAETETTKLACVVKANAYGHDDETVSLCLERKDVDFFAVSNIREAESLRRSGVKGEILILGHTPCEYAAELAENDIIQAAVSEEYAAELSEKAMSAGVKVKIHLALDTGMGRIGICVLDDPNAAAASVIRISKLEGVILDGLFTHYASADSLESEDVEYTKMQTEAFFGVCGLVKSAGVALRHTHCLNSAGGAFRYDPRSTLARFGIMLYGLKPDRSLTMPSGIEPIMELKAAVSYVKPLKAGSFVSYGRTYRAEHDIVAATIPIGYADGYPRALSGKAHVLINGRKAPIIGRVCMDQLMADVTGIPDVKEGSTVTLIGRDGGEIITADELAALSGTIGYEIVCGISRRIPRVIYRNDAIENIVEYY